MRKPVKYTIAGVLTLFVVLVLILMFSVNSIVKSSIEDIGTQMTGTAVTVDNVTIIPFSGSGQISGFRVANPEGYGREYALQIDDFSIKLKFFSLFTNEIVINEIIITAAEVYVEQKLPQNNINTLLRNVQEKTAGQTTDAAIIIDYFLMTDGSAELYTEVGGERSARVEISTLELNDLGREGGRQAVEDVIKEIAERVAMEALEAAAESGGEQIRDAIRDLFN